MTNTRTHADGFKGEYPVYVDLSKLPPAKFPWLDHNGSDGGTNVSGEAEEKEPGEGAELDEPE